MMTKFFSFRGFELPVDLVNMTGGGPETFEKISDWHIGLIQEYIGITRDAHVMEIGCGIGRDAIPLTRLIPDGYYIGTDVIRPSIDWCASNISTRYPNFKFFHHDIYDTLHNPNGKIAASDVMLPADDGDVDLIILQSVFTHMFADEIKHYMSEFRRVLKLTGKVWTTVFIVNDQILRAIRYDAKTQHALSFQYKQGDGCYINVPEEPRGAVAFEEQTIMEMISQSGLMLDKPILLGSWSGQHANPRSGQEALILRKA